MYNENFKQNEKRIVRTKEIRQDITDIMKQAEIISKIHNLHHRGITENYQKIKRKYYFPNIKEILTDYVNKCETCSLNKYERNPVSIKFKHTETTNAPLQTIHADTFALKSKVFLTIIDSFSKFASTYEIPDRQTTTMIKTFKKYFSREGIPNKLVIDSATEFNSKLFKEFANMFDIDLHVTTAKSSTGNSLIERFHSTITELVRIIYSKNKNMTITELFDEATLAYNNSIHSSTRLTPFELHRGHIVTKTVTQDLIDQPEDFLKIIRAKYKDLSETIAQKNAKQKENIINKLNKDRQDPKTFEPNDIIYEKQLTRNKLMPKYIKHTVVQDRGDHTVLTNKRTAHKKNIKK